MRVLQYQASEIRQRPKLNKILEKLTLWHLNKTDAGMKNFLRSSKEGTIGILWLKGKPIAWCCLFDSYGHEHIGIFVHPKFRKKGVGSRLIRTFLKGKNIKNIKASSFNKRSRLFWDKFGIKKGTWQDFS